MFVRADVYVVLPNREILWAENAESSCVNHLKHGLHFWVWVHTVTWRHNLYAEQPPTIPPASVNKETENKMLLHKQKKNIILVGSCTPKIVGCTILTCNNTMEALYLQWSHEVDEYWAGQCSVSTVTSVLQSLTCVVSIPPHGAGPLLKHLMDDGERHWSSIIYI